MVIVVDIEIPVEEFELGEIGNAQVTFESSVAASEAMFPYMWVETGDPVRFRQWVESEPAVRNIHLLHDEEDDEPALYRVDWTQDSRAFLACLKAAELSVLRAAGTRNGWEFRLRFDGSDALSTFQQACQDRSITLTVNRVQTNSGIDYPEQRLTQPQREVMTLALEKGYFDVPRRTTLVELADELGVSDQAISARIRRASKKLWESVLFSEPRSTEEKPIEQRP